MLFTMIDSNPLTRARFTLDNIFSDRLTEDELLHRCQALGLYATDCLSDTDPHYTIAVEADGDPVWQLHQTIKGKFMLTFFDAAELPEVGSKERFKLIERLKDFSGTPEVK